MGDQNLPSKSTINMQNGSFTLYGEHLHLGQPYQAVKKVLQDRTSQKLFLNSNGTGTWQVGNEPGTLLYGISSTYIELTFLQYKLAGIEWTLNFDDYPEKSEDYHNMSLFEQKLLQKNMELAIGTPSFTHEDGRFGYINDSYYFGAELDRDDLFCIATFEDRRLYGR